ncbi:MAG: tetratricopeptide repeat protein, partial [Candidatus Marinimicrobia bacterium]|nr:tetratricopeptide repeat protein [Candidatus Neomarinimicrobiota bacterium]
MVTDNFITEILRAATKLCGRDFGSRVSGVLKENEAALKESWQTILPTDLTTNDRNNLSIDTKFEIILSVSQGYLEGDAYDSLLIDIARIGISSLQFDRAERLLEEVKSRPASETNRTIKGSASRFLGEIYAKQANWERALEEFNAAEVLLRDSGDVIALASTMNTLGILYAETGKMSRALESFESAKKLASSKKDRDLLLKIYMNLGNILNIRGEHDGALEAYDSALTTLGKRDNDPLRALIHHNIGIAYKNKGELDRAQKKFGDGLKFSERAGDERIAGLSYLERAEIFHRKDDIDESILLATKAFKIFT